MLENGFITIKRKMLNWEWYDDINVCRLFIHLILTVNWEDKEWHGQIIKRGQRITSLQNLAKETSLTVSQTRTALDKLKMTGEITSKGTNKNSLITVANYEMYQSKEEEIANKSQAEQQTNDKQIANDMTSNLANKSQQLNNITINKKQKEKEINKEKEQNVHFAEFVTMTNAEYEKLVSTYGKEFADQCITVLDNYKGANGKTYKSDYRAILNWVIERVKQDTAKEQPKKPIKEPRFYFEKQVEEVDFNRLYDN